ncbi:MFS transporter [Pseudonocardiaceae bacterium YIM PH 21723]|nr:MFS transporter [Pseudonocardiaceae bacterium YIM PH 21723]
MRKIAIASMVGTTIEFYDFYIYGTAAALVFGKQFFPALGSAAGTVAAFATFGVAFLARPFGAVFFGHVGDRLGRKRTLVITLLVMGGATVAIGLVPGTATIGVAAPMLLVLLRILQGFALGGEWAGAVLLTAEHSSTRLRGRYGMFPVLGAPIGLALSSATFVVIEQSLGSAAFLDWGWRLPFLVSVLLVGVGLYVRLRITEPAVFTELPVRSRVPLLEVLRTRLRLVLLVSGAMTLPFAYVFTANTFLTSYGTAVLGHPRGTVLAYGICSGITFGLAVIGSALLSDRLGRRAVILGGCLFSLVWALLLFPLADTRSPLLFAVAMCVTTACVGVHMGPAGSYLPELFATRYRYTGVGVGYNLAGILGGAVPPLLSAVLVRQYGGTAVGFLLAAFALLSLGCVLALVETRHRVLAEV